MIQTSFCIRVLLPVMGGIIFSATPCNQHKVFICYLLLDAKTQ